VFALLSDTVTAGELEASLLGYPRRYIQTRSSAEIAQHYQVRLRREREPIQVQLAQRNHFFEFTLMAADRPFLFATIAGALAALGMNIVEAEAFFNNGGIVLDTFHFKVMFRTLELNPSEIERFRSTNVDVLAGKVSLDSLLQGRFRGGCASHQGQTGNVGPLRFCEFVPKHASPIDRTRPAGSSL
jgi:[protein-PII] uridylyltransferase